MHQGGHLQNTGPSSDCSGHKGQRVEGNDPCRGLLSAGFRGWREAHAPTTSVTDQASRAEVRTSWGLGRVQHPHPTTGGASHQLGNAGSCPGSLGRVCGYSAARVLAVTSPCQGSWGCSCERGGGAWSTNNLSQLASRWWWVGRPESTGAPGRGAGTWLQLQGPALHKPGAGPAHPPSRGTFLGVPVPCWAWGEATPVLVVTARQTPHCFGELRKQR